MHSPGLDAALAKPAHFGVDAGSGDLKGIRLEETLYPMEDE